MTSPAQALNTRVSIADFQWSNNELQVDLGETVTWDWIGPDTMHSVTGEPSNATQWNSDPGNVRPHPLGDTFSVTFDQPGVYSFVCKLHASVNGTVVVSNTPGNPESDPGPQPALNYDFEIPNVEVVYVTKSVIGHKGNGTGLNFGINERGTGSADFYKLVKKGKGKKKKTVRKFAGFQNWSNHIGNNRVKFAQRTGEFRAKPGKYVALAYFTDESFNSTPAQKIKFKIKGKNKKK
jgi:plastocyanin